LKFDKERIEMKKTVVAAAAAAALVSVSSAEVLPADMFRRMDVNNDGAVTREEYINLFIPQFARKDADKDGFLSPEEFGPPPAAFKRADKDGDGRLSYEEFIG